MYVCTWCWLIVDYWLANDFISIQILIVRLSGTPPVAIVVSWEKSQVTEFIKTDLFTPSSQHFYNHRTFRSARSRLIALTWTMYLSIKNLNYSRAQSPTSLCLPVGGGLPKPSQVFTKHSAVYSPSTECSLCDYFRIPCIISWFNVVLPHHMGYIH